MKARISLCLTVSLLLASLAVGLGQAQGPQPQMALGTPFTYQGQLRQNGSLVNGTCDFQFSMWSAATGGSQTGSSLIKSSVAVSRGLFTVLLDFGTAPFQGADRYLQIAVRCPSGSGVYTTLTGRQALTATPYALYAASAPWVGLLNVPPGFADNVDDDTTYTAGAGLTLIGNQFSVTFAGTGSASTVARSDHDHDNRYWKLSGNSGTNQAANYVGTTDNVPLNFRVNGTRALRLEPNAIGPNVIGGFVGNNVTAGASASTISGGGSSGNVNRVTDSYGTVGGGNDNQAGDGNINLGDAAFATVAGGWDNTASGDSSVVGGGAHNNAGGDSATVGGGYENAASGDYATVPGGYLNEAAGQFSLAAGKSAKANHNGAFVWADASGADFASARDNQFAVRATGGVVFTSTHGAMLRLQPDPHSPSIIGGHTENSATSEGATISGGGKPGGGNSVTNGYGTVGGGYGNRVGGDCATIGGGKENTASGDAATVGGGGGNTATEFAATVGGGVGNSATGRDSTVGGGLENRAAGEASTVAGGRGNTASSMDSTVAGGNGNAAGAPFSTVSGGFENQATGERSTVAGGYGNLAGAYSATVGGGQGNDATATRATISGGQDNTAEGTYTSIGGGQNNGARGSYATIGGGNTNAISISGIAATVGGGQNNEANNMYATVGGGYYNTAGGNRATVPGGHHNTAQGDYSFAAGRRAQANNPGCFVWGDSTDADVVCSNNNRFIVRASGGIYLYSNNSLTTGVYLAAGASTWTPVSGYPSDRNLKENFRPVDGRDVLRRLANVPISAWNYKADGESIRHLGPVAQDFYAAFGLGENDGTIDTVDAEGVALAALQGAYALLQEKDAQIAAQQEQIDDLESRVAALEALVAQLARK